MICRQCIACIDIPCLLARKAIFLNHHLWMPMCIDACFKLHRTCGLVAMTSASHAEGRQFDPGQVYFPSRAVSRTRSRNRLGGAAGIEPTQKNPIGPANSTP